MSNVLKFTPRTPKPQSPETTWDKLAAQSEIGLVTYQLHQILQAASWAYQIGKIREGDKFIAACREFDFEPEVDLGKELGDLLEIADRTVALTGVKAQSKGKAK